VNKLRLTTYAALLQIAAQKGYDRSWAETFFRHAAARGAADDDAIEPQPGAVSGGSTAGSDMRLWASRCAGRGGAESGATGAGGGSRR
jgi:hypothetical protein